MSKNLILTIISVFSILVLIFLIPNSNKDKKYIKLLKQNIETQKTQLNKNLEEAEAKYNSEIIILNSKLTALKQTSNQLEKDKAKLKNELVLSKQELDKFKEKLESITIPTSKEEASKILNELGFKNSIKECL